MSKADFLAQIDELRARIEQLEGGASDALADPADAAPCDCDAGTNEATGKPLNS